MSDQFEQNFAKLQEQEFELHTRKRNDYTGGGHPLSNYIAIAEFMGVPTAMVIVGRMREKLQRIGNLLRGTEQRVMDETIEDTLRDLAIMAKLAHLAIEDEAKDYPPDPDDTGKGKAV